MKKLTLLLQSLILVIVFSIIFSACGGSKKIQNVTNAQKITLPFQGKNYVTDKSTIRAVASANSKDLQAAKTESAANARAEIGATIKVTMQRVGDDYKNSRQIDDQKEFEKKYESFTREVINETMSGSFIADYDQQKFKEEFEKAIHELGNKN